ncbi:YifB family Mg chelatase-like AAA ATPase [Actinospongicola halichondriae]|uniref:YifB family Mg chelatase-like AAA ATPase n=1 Tax=Actinospongicola halichondriae TaxID=3236844 RepID=UPI003D4FF860
MLAIIQSSSLLGVEGRCVRAEVHVGNGLPSFTMVGLPDASCREARDRVRSAVLSSEFEWPMRRLTINLAPSAFPKLGTSLDLAIAIGVLSAVGQVPDESTERWAFLGELGLDGSVRPVRGMVPLVAALRGVVEGVVVGASAHSEAALVPGIEVRSAPDLGRVVRALRGEAPWSDPPVEPPREPPPLPDLLDVRGQPVGRQVLEIAAAGGHHLLLSGPPGAGKTLLASRLPGLLPDLDDDAALEVTSIHSAAGVPVEGELIRRPPFRAPHHTASAVSLIGGGTTAMRPGEISLAHRGVLFADELGEFPPTVLDALRQPIEEGRVRVSRARGTVAYPARFQFVAATNPCPCGPTATGCRCSEAGLARYARRLSGPLLDRFDLRLHVGRPDAADLLGAPDGEPTAVVAGRVLAARRRADARGHGVNASLHGPALDVVAPLTPRSATLLEDLVRRGTLTARGVERVRRVARTIADLAEQDGALDVDHVAAAAALRVPVGESAAVAS